MSRRGQRQPCLLWGQGSYTPSRGYPKSWPSGPGFFNSVSWCAKKIFCIIIVFMNKFIFYWQYRKPGPLGLVRVQRLCQLNDPWYLQSSVVPTTEQGEHHGPLFQAISHDMVLPISYRLDPQISISDIGRGGWGWGRSVHSCVLWTPRLPNFGT